MTPLFGVCLPWLLMVTAVASAQKNFNQRTGLATECLGNVLRVTLDKSLTIGNHLEIDAMNGSQIVPLTPGLAAKCGYSMESDPWGNTKVYASLLNCFADNQEDGVFDLGMQFRMYGDHKSEEDKRVVTKTCRYNQWAPREILCDRNYIEVSIFRLTPDIEKVPGLPEGPDHGGKMEDDQWASAVDEVCRSILWLCLLLCEWDVT
ncbi:uncharacterized protein LOC115818327 [Chanos chanos]|uniref:Uncharacterized protein LOC115818327 n=1 Tax=Chanos chanos TaxID=29144 RepID=A0A6J2W2G8_CHACN|nr:uncharacterized protein LOC115818327 [Chanos chanos]